MNGVLQTIVEENGAMCGVVVECGFPIKIIFLNRLTKFLRLQENSKLVPITSNFLMKCPIPKDRKYF